MQKIHFILYGLLLILLGSCENAFFDEDAMASDPRKNFDYLWKECDRKYSFFDYKHIDWNAVYNTYSPMVKTGMTDDELFTVMSRMLEELKDGHVNIVSSFNVSRYEFYRTAPKSYDDRLVRDYYMGDSFYVTGPFRHDFVKGHPDIGYLRFDAFTGTVTDHQLDFILQRYANTRGLIFDIRQNGGGVVADLFTILARFINHETLLYTVYLKNGPGHNDFTSGEKTMLSPSGAYRYDKKVMVLTDRGTFSAGSFLSTATKSIDNMILVGDTTGGGMGIPNGGQMPNGWTYRFSVTKTLDINGQLYENGVPPDVYVKYDQVQAANGVDNIIETAITLF